MTPDCRKIHIVGCVIGAFSVFVRMWCVSTAGCAGLRWDGHPVAESTGRSGTVLLSSHGRLAQRESASFTPKRSLVRTQHRPLRGVCPGCVRVDVHDCAGGANVRAVEFWADGWKPSRMAAARIG